MDAAFWQRTNELFESVVELPESERTTFLASLRETEPEQEKAVRSLLEGMDEADEFFGGMEENLSDAIANSQLDPLLAGTRIGPYEVVEEIGSGGMAMVYLAKRVDGEFEQEVALKVLKKGVDTAEMVQRFRSEKQILAQLQHPYIAQIFDGGITPQGTPYFVMEHIKGVPLQEYLAQQDLTSPDRISLFLKICDAVQHAHRNLVIHRDLKPSNILVTQEGNPKLLDFGIAKLLNPSDFSVDQVQTQTEQRLLTPDYASPEQMRGAPITTATDVYQLGLLLYELLAESRPFDLAGATYSERYSAITEKNPDIPSQKTQLPAQARFLKGDLDNIIMMALRKEPERRYPSVDVFAEDLRLQAQNLPVRAQKDTLNYRTRKYYQRNRLLVNSVLVGLGIVATLVVLYTRALAEERDRARAEAEKALSTSEFMQELFYQANEMALQGEEIAASELLDIGVERLDTLQAAPELRAALYQAVGLTYMGMGLNESAEKPLRQALKLRPKTENPTQDDVNAYLGLGSIDLQQSNFRSADSLLNRSLTLSKKLPQPEYTSMVNLLVSLSELGLHNGDLALAEKYAIEAERLTLERQDSVSDYAASVLFAKGYLYLKKEEFDKAIPSFIKLRAMAFERSGGQVSPFVAGASHNLSATYRDAGQLTEAMKLADEAIAAWDESVGIGSSFYLDIRQNASTVYYQLEKYPESLEILRGSYQITQEIYEGEINSLGSEVIQDLAQGYRAVGQWDSAQYFAKQLIPIQAEIWGENSMEVAYAHSRLAFCYSLAKDYAEADLHWDSAFVYFSQNRPSTEYYITLLDRGSEFEVKGNPDSALVYFNRAKGLHAEIPDLSSFEKAKLYSRMGELYQNMGNKAAAKEAFEQAREFLDPQNEHHGMLRARINRLSAA